MNAYSETYVSGAQRRLGAMFDFAVNGCGFSLASAHALFCASMLSKRFEVGDPAIVAGRSGEELALELLGSAAMSSQDAWRPSPAATSEFWTGWALAFYQWASGFSFGEIEQRVAIRDIHTLYHPYHEQDVRQFCDKMDALIAAAQPGTNLQVRRLAAGLSQRQLADAAGIPVRTLQQYEQRQKDINHARADYIVALSRVLSCEPREVLEHGGGSRFDYAVAPLNT